MESFTIDQPKQIVAFYREHGYVVVRDLLRKEQLDAMKQEVHAIAAAEAKRLGLDKQPPQQSRGFDEYIVELMQHDPAYRSRLYKVFLHLHSVYALSHSEELKKVMSVLGLQCPNFRNLTVRMDIPGEEKFLQPFHQDIREVRALNCINFWTTLHDVDIESGGLQFFPGSHKLGPLVPERTNESGYQIFSEETLRQVRQKCPEAVCALKEGSVLAFSPMLLHGSNINKTQFMRWTLNIRFDDAIGMEYLQNDENPFDKYDVQNKTVFTRPSW